MCVSKLLTRHYAGRHAWHALLANYIISCNAHSCGLQVTLGLGIMQYYAKVMAMAFTALVCKLEQCDMVVCELIVAVHYACA